MSETDKCTLTWGRRGVGQWRRTPRTSCSTRTAFHRPALPESESVPSPAPTAPRVSGDAAQRPPRAGALPNSPLGAGARPSARRTQPAAATVYSCGHAPAQLRRAFAFAPPLPPLPSLSLKRGGPPGPRLPAALLCGPGLCISILSVSLWPPIPPRHRHWKAVFQIAVVNCTCLANYLWESVGGAERWKMLLRFAGEGKLCHSARVFCPA